MHLHSCAPIVDGENEYQGTWDAEDSREGTTDWYATGYLTNYFLSLAGEELQPDFPDTAAARSRIQELEEQLRVLREQQGIAEDERYEDLI